MPIPRPCHFEALWSALGRSRSAAAGLAEGSRATFATSMALGIVPAGPDELFALGNPRLTDPFADGPTVARFYIRAEQLADRLRRDWGHPDIFGDGPSVAGHITGRRGVIFFENWLHSTRHAYAKQAHRIVSTLGLPLYSPFAEKVEGTVTGIEVAWPASPGHVDLWNGDRTGHGYVTSTIREAQRVWLWIGG